MSRIYGLVLLVGLFFMDCAVDPLAGGSTDTELGGTVVGVVLNENGQSERLARVTLLPDDFNPVLDGAIPNYLIDTTDQNGVFCLHSRDTGKFTVEAVDYAQKTRAFVAGIAIYKDTVHVEGVTLQQPGTIEIHIPDTSDTAGGYAYIPGTGLYKYFADAVPAGIGKYALRLDSVPAANVPVVVCISGDWEIFTAEQISIPSNETVIIDLSANIIKPLWDFALIVGVSVQTVSFYGGMDSVAVLVKKHVKGMTDKFNTTGVFNGVYRPTVDSIYQYSDDITVERDKPMTGFDYRLLYDGYSAWGNGGWYYDTRTVCRVWSVTDGSGTFGQGSVDITTWEFGQARGAIAYSWIEVDADKNPVNGTAYASTVESIMNWPYGVNVWDKASVNLINYYADTLYIKPNIINRAFPASMGVVVKSAIGTELPGASVKLYGIKLHSRTVDKDPVLSGVTDSTGEFIFPKNPYNPDASAYLTYYNMLISVECQGDTAYAWEPVFNATNAWFAKPDSAYRVVVHF